MLIANLGMLYNKISRISTFIFFLCFTYFWLLDKGYFNNHYYFISLMCLLLSIVEKQPSFFQNIHIPRISLFSLQAMVFIVYFIAGINKLNTYWLIDFQPMKHILELKAEITNNPVFKKETIIMLACYFGLLFDLFIGFLLFWKKSRAFAFILALTFHLSNHYLFSDVGEIGVFPFIMIASLILFINPQSLNQILKLDKKQKRIFNTYPLIRNFIFSFLIIQLLLPFRHLLFQGYVDYNGIGQRFAWRMKIMYKESDINYFIINKITQEKYSVNIKPMLTHRQYNNLKYFPDLIVPLAKKIKKEANEKFDIKNAKITCEYKIRFMGGAEQLLFSPELDLTKIKPNTLSNKWLWPLKK
tara:strand:+ start:245 stop:1315 length:1071 start_codon:yes stop_codon:yes gene_type:complete